MLPRKYVSLLPASGPRTDPDQSSSSGNTQEDTNKRKRVGTQIACNSCRIKKTRVADPATKCDGRRPTCGPCRKRTADCAYSPRKDLGEEPHELLELLKWLPEHRAVDVLRVLRANDGDCAAALSVIKSGPGGTRRPSDYNVPLGEIPAQSPLEIELMARHTIAYPMLQPISIAALQESNLLRSVRSHRPTELSFQRPIDTRDPLVTGELFNIDADSAVKLYRLHGAKEDSLPISRDYCDDRLSGLDITAWTTVQVSNELAARIISLYLKTDHPMLGTFDPDLFVSDLITQQRRFCSSLLVNALLYWGSQMYSAIDKEVKKHARLFCAEAERLWLEAKHTDTLLNMAGAQLLSLAFMGHGKDHACLKYLTEAVNMGVRLKLFGRLDAIGEEDQRKMAVDDQSATSFAAWGIFNWSVLTTIFYRQPGISYPDSPPVCLIPGNIQTGLSPPTDVDSTSEEASISPKRSLPAYMGTTFTFLCQLWRIVHEFTQRYYNEKCKTEPPKLDFAEMKYRELLAWMQNLPTELVRGEGNPHHVLVFHIWIHAVVLDLFRPFVKDPEMRHARLRTFSARHGSPRTAFDASVEQLKHLIIDYRTGYESSAYSILWHTALMCVANAVLVSKDADWRVYFLLCIYGYESLNRPFRVSEAIGTSLLTMTLRNSDITIDEARGLLLELKERGLVHLPSEGTIRATFMGDLELAMSDPEAARVENLANNFEDMVLFREFVNDGSIEDVAMVN
ncbi:hypothetical protein PG993_012169 [Apiospora rasikravindrae]|uniref:Zn(2)-C6 fungal-type domain-containing protein n=1 Tax=Apiospora rasikravindrae TaxID=990691 RepID=A0ABR1S1U5_9PEZI